LIKKNTDITVHLNRAFAHMEGEEGQILPVYVVSGTVLESNNHWIELMPENPGLENSIFIPTHSINFIANWK